MAAFSRGLPPSSPTSPLLRRRVKKYSQATLTRILLAMLAAAFVFYVAIMIAVASTSPSTPTAASNVQRLDPTTKNRMEVKHDRSGRIVDDHDEQGVGGNSALDTTLRAYLEPIHLESWEIKPLPVRTTTAADLRVISYPRLQSCTNLPRQFPVDEYPDADPFLPWIHDVFPTWDGTFIQFVAQNKRRCRTGTTPDEAEIRKQMQPQVALFQHVPIQRILHHGKDDEVRYRLSSHQDADEDGVATRFICRFKPTMQETLSVFNFDYDYAAWRKGRKQTFSLEGRDIKSIHTSQLIFQCPVPKALQQTVRDGSSVKNDYATMFVDIIPIRTPPRYDTPDRFFQPRYKEFQNETAPFQTLLEWGDNHILPRIEDSGRWENIPICKPSLMTYGTQVNEAKHPMDTALTATNPKRHHLVACTWASTGYSTRGGRFGINDGQRRLKEWIQFNLLVGFDHIYIFDNSGAHSNSTSLKPIADLFPDRVTRIDWPAKICNNNRNFDDSPGERSSQYAAESSCRLRFGPHTEWLGAFDIDEYMVPMGNETSLLPLLDKLDKKGTKIISFGSWRAWPRKALIEEPVKIDDNYICGSVKPCFELKVPPNRTILQTYNCDRQNGQKQVTMPAEKQVYRPDYVKQHFVHYSTVTALSVMSKTETVKARKRWHRQISQDPSSRFANEIEEATMLHTKSVATQDTAGWVAACKSRDSRSLCRIGNPYPPGALEANQTHDANGWRYTCFVNQKIETYWVPRLNQALGLTG